ncbi:bactofilin family protein [Pseudobacteriovorax antillogorgiicola]|uniref:Polymer-forming protein n=1 Tax=Pseudobacteriovorax antillogorgiicola TaxID=1513793 RepID=A0A1Y6B6R7_9BACT|nr:polymer-forming cytoskeletal protein [Pseudobacteriovorax antillogorgiicola]TCS59455.1 polymer-forming protein [Pseudobacteriovorax antillogorgiicola]SME88183.1 Polymer-forming protein [Pseudobacteriovorax antillogorgiicola]
MFNQQKKAAVKQVKKEQTKDYAVTILTSGCHFAGKMFCRGSTRVGGKVEGEIISEGLLILEEEAVVNANINCDEIVLQGRITGIIRAKTRVEMSRTCTFSGDVITPCLVIEEGAQFSGRSTMDGANAEISDKQGKLIDEVKAPKVDDLSSDSVPEVSVKSPQVAAEAQ